MQPQALKDRLAKARSRQVQALAEAGRAPLRSLGEGVAGGLRQIAAGRGTPPAVPALPTTAGRPERNLDEVEARHPELALRLRELDALLGVVAEFHGYGADDLTAVWRAVTEGPGAARELDAAVRQYRIDLVAAGLDLVEGALPLGVARRARLQFRMTVMGRLEDESGRPLDADALQFR